MIIEAHNYVSDDDVEFIRKQCRHAVASNNSHKFSYNRDGDTVDITHNTNPDIQAVDKKLCQIMKNIQKEIVGPRYKPQYSSADSGYEYHCYNSGEICHYHSDGEVMNGLLRYASVIIHLTSNEEGGETVFPSQNKVIKTEKGKVVIFPPYGMFGHYVTPSNTQREVIVSWFVYQGITVSN